MLHNKNSGVCEEESGALGIHNSDSSRNLVKIDGNLDSTKYIQLLNVKLIQDLDKGETFWHDGAPRYRLHAI